MALDFKPPVFGTAGTIPQIPETSPKDACEAKGGTWDELTQTCLPAFKPPEEKVKPQKVKPTAPEVGEIQGTAKQVVRLPDGREFFGLNKDEVAQLVASETKPDIPLGAQPAGTAQRRAEERARGEQLAGQVGEFGQLGVSPTGLEFGEAATTGIVASIPSALRLAATGAGIGLVGGATVAGPIGAGAGAAIGAVAGFVSGIASGMIGSFKSQRTDTTTSQQRVLDEGKQTLMDWVTLARSDPSNKAFYLAQYNKQLAQINQAHRQMKLDTSRDLAKFETALPNLAEFNSFYSIGGERDALNEEMRIALTTVSPEGYDMLALTERRK